MRVQLLLTACINPNSSEALAIKDASTRKKQYLEALQWYLDNTDYGITFCENSGTHISLSELNMGGRMTDWKSLLIKVCQQFQREEKGIKRWKSSSMPFCILCICLRRIL